MPEFPMPSLGLSIDTIFGYTSQFLDLLDEKRFLYVLLVFSIVLYVARWAIGKLQRPPSMGM